MRLMTVVLSVCAATSCGTWAVAAAEKNPAGADVPLFEPGPDGKVVIFNGRDFDGWDADPKYWSVDNGEIVASGDADHPYSYLTTKKAVRDFRLVFKVKLVPNTGNSGVQFRSVRLSAQAMKGPQADIGKGWWGQIYDEHGRGLITKKSGDQFVRPEDWNTYEILAVGSRVRTAINGNLCADIDDDRLRQEGVIGLQLHSGGRMEVRFKDLMLELNPKFELLTVKPDR